MHQAHGPTATAMLTGSGVPTAKLGVWWFLASEIVTFGGLIGSYVVMRLAAPHFLTYRIPVPGAAGCSRRHTAGTATSR